MRTKFALFLFCLFEGLNICYAAIPAEYTMITDISTLQDGDRVVLYSTAIWLGVTGWNGDSDATVAASGWAEYIVEPQTGGIYLKDAVAGKYISNPDPTYNTFAYSETPSLCKLSDSFYFMCGTRYLSQDGTNCRFYTSSNTPFYLYKVPAIAVEAPVLSPPEGAISDDGTFTTPFQLTITCATEGAEIYYTLDGTDPVSSESREQYQSPLTISQTTTIRAIATDGTYNSKEVSATYRLEKGYAASIAEFIDAAPTASYELRLSEAQQAVITAYNANDNLVYIQDKSGRGMIIRYYGSEVPAGATVAGNQLIGSLYGELDWYENKPRMKSVTFSEDMQIVAAKRPEPVVVQSLDASTYAAYPLMLVKIEDVTFSTNDKIVKDGVQYGYYDEFSVFTKRALPDDTVRCHIIGIMTQFNGLAYKIIPISPSDIDTQGALAALPTITPFGGNAQDKAVSTDIVRIKLAKNTTIIVNDVSYAYAKDFRITEANTSLTITAVRDFYTNNTITLWYEPATPAFPTAVIGTAGDKHSVPQKRIVNNQLIIIGIDNNVYNAQGMRIK